MNPDQIQQAAQLLAEARRSHTAREPLPDALQLSTTYVAVVRPQATPAAAALVDRLTDARGVERFRAAGFQ